MLHAFTIVCILRLNDLRVEFFDGMRLSAAILRFCLRTEIHLTPLAHWRTATTSVIIRGFTARSLADIR